MLRNWDIDIVNWLFVIGIALLVLEVTFFGGGLFIAFAIGLACIYFGKKQKESSSKKALILFGAIVLIITIISMMTFRFLVLVIVLGLLYQYYQSKKNPQVIQPLIKFEKDWIGEKKLKRKPLFQNFIYGRKQTPKYVYEWNDIHILLGVGDVIIDLSNTVLPKDAVISIRGIVGNVQIFLPYEVEFSFHHTSLYSHVNLLNEIEDRIINESIYYETALYHSASEKVKIFTSTIVGKIEVRRI